MFESDSNLIYHNITQDNRNAILTHDHLNNLLTHAVPTEGLLDWPEEVHVDKVCNFKPRTYAGNIAL